MVLSSLLSSKCHGCGIDKLREPSIKVVLPGRCADGPGRENSTKRSEAEERYTSSHRVPGAPRPGHAGAAPRPRASGAGLDSNKSEGRPGPLVRSMILLDSVPVKAQPNHSPRRQRKAFGLSIHPFDRNPFERSIPSLRGFSGERKSHAHPRRAVALVPLRPLRWRATVHTS
jgi:hypothetical protein